ncbi:neurogenic locus protein delta-like [Limulus polyphemus]|uniref:Delta-like protein n=1 Tax=Limulus polyphemus TaxID=6850 RepID=A0ABM1SUV0_LIMPO|nr:neurogenic locus protein delta-like [Limulus polyphemus]
MGRRERASLLVIVVLSSIVLQVSSSGAFEFRLVSFSNDNGRDFEGNCCTGYRTSHGLCSGVCRTSFRVCLKHYQTTIDPNPPCTFGEIRTPVLGNNSVRLLDKKVPGFINPIRFPFDFSWPGTFSLIVEAWHENNNREAGGNTLVSRLATQRWLDVSPEWTQDAHRTNHTTMTYSFRVLCEENYYGDACAKLCRPRDETFGHYSCNSKGDKICLPGWTGEYCSNAICLLGCHKENGRCDEPNKCKCRYGWEGPLCQQCTRYPNCVHGTCTQPWQCNCEEGWGGLLCNQDLNYCTNHKPCKNGGTCTNTGQGSYTCTCPEGITGTNCEFQVDNCALQPCQNGGKCKQTNKTYKCECPRGFYGRNCETSTNTCSASHCQNGGTCQNGPDGYFCTCPDGFSGDHCELQPDNCEPNPCLNGGSCVQRVDTYTCICETGFTGDLCDMDINDCAENPCLNGGTCVDNINSFHCSCVPGFVGSLCQTNVDDCLIKPCANGGVCHDLINDFQCDCQSGFTSKDCSVEIDECRSNPCLNGGTCVDRVNEILCRCPLGFGGIACEENAHAVEDKSSSARFHRVKFTKNMSLDGLKVTPPTSVLEVSHHISDDVKQSRLTSHQVALIATLSALIPLLALIAVLLIIFFRRRKQQEREHEDEIVQKQNTVNSMNNKLLDNKIINSIGRPNQKSLNISTESQDIPSILKGQENMHRTNISRFLNKDCCSRHSDKTLDTDYEKQLSSSQRALERRGSTQSITSVSSIVNKSESSSSCPHSSVYVIEENYKQEFSEGILATEV